VTTSAAEAVIEIMLWWVDVTATGRTGYASRFVENTAVERIIGVADRALAYREALGKRRLPFREVSVPTELERSESELTMRSHSTFEMHRYTSDSRRMVYYAVGCVAANKKDDRGGGNENSKFEVNWRCYLSGKPILYGMPFYTGSVQHGLRTLIVFCLLLVLDHPSSECRHLADDGPYLPPLYLAVRTCHTFPFPTLTLMPKSNILL
jgi:hypothetical protein